MKKIFVFSMLQRTVSSRKSNKKSLCKKRPSRFRLGRFYSFSAETYLPAPAI